MVAYGCRQKHPKHRNATYLFRDIMTLWRFIFMLMIVHLTTKFVMAQSRQPAPVGVSMSHIQIPLSTPAIASKPVAKVVATEINKQPTTYADHIMDGAVAVAGSVVQRINCGSMTPFTDDMGMTWEPDSMTKYFDRGKIYSNFTLPITNTKNDLLYQTERTANGTVTYSIPVMAKGMYSVELHFAEIYFDKANRRLFHIIIEGQTMATKYDVWKRAGGKGLAVVEVYKPILVADHLVTIQFVTVWNQMKISAIVVRYMNDSTMVPRCTPIAPIPTAIAVPMRTPYSSIKLPQSVFVPNAPIKVPIVPASLPIRIPSPVPMIVIAPMNAPIVTQIVPSVRSPAFVPFLSQDPVTKPLLSFVPVPVSTPANFPLLSTSAPASVIVPESGPTDPVIAPITRPEPTLSPIEAPTNPATSTAPTLPPPAIVSPVMAPFINVPMNATPVHGPENNVSPVITTPTEAEIPLPIFFSPPANVITSPLPLSLPSSESSEPSVTPTVSDFQNIFINCGAGPYNDSIGRYWEGDMYYDNGDASSDLELSITNTIDDFIYQTERTGIGSLLYEIPVPAGEYNVELHFAEIYWDAGKVRLMDIKLQDIIVAANFDVWTAAGGKGKRIVLEYTVLVEKNELNIELDAKVDQYTISGIVVQRQGDHLAHAVAGGPYVAVDIDGDGFGIVSVDAFRSHTHGLGLALTKFEWRFNGEIVASTQQANLTIPVGSHEITLVVEDDGGNRADTFTAVQIFDMGFPFVDNLSPSSGDVLGGTEVIIHGAGFNWPQDDILVIFGDKELKGADIVVLDEYQIKIIGTPSNQAGESVSVVVKSPVATSNPIIFTYYAGVPIEFTFGELVAEYDPTTITFGPDGILYVGTLGGDLLKIELDDDLNVLSLLRSSVVGGDRNIMGIAFNPLDVGVNPKVYVSHSKLFHGSCEHSAGLGINGKLSLVSGANLDTIEDIVTGLPVSDHDHGPNGIHFGDNGEMYMMIGGNTNAGVPGGLSGCGEQKENIFSGACLKFDLKRSDFNGFIEYDATSGNVTSGVGIEVFAPGSRNSWDVVLHSNGYLYSTDNGPNKDYGKRSVDCDNFGLDPDFPDELNILFEGDYYGHANRKRGEGDQRQCTYYGPDSPSIPGLYRAPLLTFPSSTDGIVEWETEHFNGQLRGNLIVGQFVSVLWRVILSRDGLSALNGPIVLHPQGGLDVTQGPDGTLFVAGVGAGKVTYLIPDETPSLVIVVKASWPRRGPLSGGNVLTVYGELLTIGGNPKIFVGGSPCFVITFNEIKVKCILPSGFGIADVILTSGSFNSTLHAGYRYISG